MMSDFNEKPVKDEPAAEANSAVYAAPAIEKSGNVSKIVRMY